MNATRKYKISTTSRHLAQYFEDAQRQETSVLKAGPRVNAQKQGQKRTNNLLLGFVDPPASSFVLRRWVGWRGNEGPGFLSQCLPLPQTEPMPFNWNDFKRLFVVEEEGAAASQSPTPSANPSVQTSAAPPARPSTGTTVPSASAVPTGAAPEQKFLEILFQALQANNLDGFDYLEFRNALQSLEKVNPDEITRYKSALAMAQSMGANTPGLIQSAQHYLTVLGQEQNKFEAVLAKQTKAQVDDRVAMSQNLQKDIALRNQQIAQLQQEIDKTKQKLQQLEQELGEAQSKMEFTRNGFIASYQTVVQQIQKDIEKMHQYLES